METSIQAYLHGQPQFWQFCADDENFGRATRNDRTACNFVQFWTLACADDAGLRCILFNFSHFLCICQNSFAVAFLQRFVHHQRQTRASSEVTNLTCSNWNMLLLENVLLKSRRFKMCSAITHNIYFCVKNINTQLFAPIWLASIFRSVFLFQAGLIANAPQKLYKPKEFTLCRIWLVNNTTDFCSQPGLLECIAKVFWVNWERWLGFALGGAYSR